MEKNPKESIAAILGVGGKLTLGRLALLERVNSPVLQFDFSNLNKDIEAAYLYAVPFEVAVKSKDTATDSLMWLESVGYEAYDEAFGELVDALAAFYDMLPPQKKTEETSDSGTDGLQN